MVHMWAQWLPNPCHCGGPQCSARGQNHKWPTCGHTRYLTPAVSGVPNALQRGTKSQKAHQWAQWPPNPCRLRGPHCFGWGINRKWPTSGHTGYQTSAVSGVLKAFNGGQNQKWPTCGHNGYLTRAVSGVPNALYRGIKSEMAYMWAQWLPNPCRLGGPQCFGRGTKSEMAHMRAQWLPDPCRLGGPQRSERGPKSEMAHMRAQWLPNPCRLGVPNALDRGQNQKWPTCGHSGYLTPAVSGSPMLWIGDKIRNGPHVGTVAT